MGTLRVAGAPSPSRPCGLGRPPLVWPLVWRAHWARRSRRTCWAPWRPPDSALSRTRPPRRAVLTRCRQPRSGHSAVRVGGDSLCGGRSAGGRPAAHTERQGLSALDSLEADLRVPDRTPHSVGVWRAKGSWKSPRRSYGAPWARSKPASAVSPSRRLAAGLALPQSTRNAADALVAGFSELRCRHAASAVEAGLEY